MSSSADTTVPPAADARSRSHHSMVSAAPSEDSGASTHTLHSSASGRPESHSSSQSSQRSYLVCDYDPAQYSFLREFIEDLHSSAAEMPVCTIFLAPRFIDSNIPDLPDFLRRPDYCGAYILVENEGAPQLYYCHVDHTLEEIPDCDLTKVLAVFRETPSASSALPTLYLDQSQVEDLLGASFHSFSMALREFYAEVAIEAVKKGDLPTLEALLSPTKLRRLYEGLLLDMRLQSRAWCVRKMWAERQLAFVKRVLQAPLASYEIFQEEVLALKAAMLREAEVIFVSGEATEVASLQPMQKAFFSHEQRMLEETAAKIFPSFIPTVFSEDDLTHFSQESFSVERLTAYTNELTTQAEECLCFGKQCTEKRKHVLEQEFAGLFDPQRQKKLFERLLNNFDYALEPAPLELANLIQDKKANLSNILTLPEAAIYFSPIPLSIRNNEGQSLLDIAFEAQQFAVVLFLLGRGITLTMDTYTVPLSVEPKNEQPLHALKCLVQMQKELHSTPSTLYNLSSACQHWYTEAYMQYLQTQWLFEAVREGDFASMTILLDESSLHLLPLDMVGISLQETIEKEKTRWLGKNSWLEDSNAFIKAFILDCHQRREKILAHQEKEKGSYCYLLPSRHPLFLREKLPEQFQDDYIHAYLLVHQPDEQPPELYYGLPNRQFERVALNDIEKILDFLRTKSPAASASSSKIWLNEAHVDDLISSNGGHHPSPKLPIVPEKKHRDAYFLVLAEPLENTKLYYCHRQDGRFEEMKVENPLLLLENIRQVDSLIFKEVQTNQRERILPLNKEQLRCMMAHVEELPQEDVVVYPYSVFFSQTREEVASQLALLLKELIVYLDDPQWRKLLEVTKPLTREQRAWADQIIASLTEPFSKPIDTWEDLIKLCMHALKRYRYWQALIEDHHVDDDPMADLEEGSGASKAFDSVFLEDSLPSFLQRALSPLYPECLPSKGYVELLQSKWENTAEMRIIFPYPYSLFLTSENAVDAFMAASDCAEWRSFEDSRVAPAVQQTEHQKTLRAFLNLMASCYFSPTSVDVVDHQNYGLLDRAMQFQRRAIIYKLLERGAVFMNFGNLTEEDITSIRSCIKEQQQDITILCALEKAIQHSNHTAQIGPEANMDAALSLLLEAHELRELLQLPSEVFSGVIQHIKEQLLYTFVPMMRIVQEVVNQAKIAADRNFLQSVFETYKKTFMHLWHLLREATYAPHKNLPVLIDFIQNQCRLQFSKNNHRLPTNVRQAISKSVDELEDTARNFEVSTELAQLASGGRSLAMVEESFRDALVTHRHCLEKQREERRIKAQQFHEMSAAQRQVSAIDAQELVRLKHESVETKAALATMTENFEASRKRVGNLESQVAISQQQVGALQEELAETKATSQQQVEALQEELAETKATSQQQVGALQEELAETRAQMKGMQAMMIQLMARFTSSEGAVPNAVESAIPSAIPSGVVPLMFAVEQPSAVTGVSGSSPVVEVAGGASSDPPIATAAHPVLPPAQQPQGHQP